LPLTLSWVELALNAWSGRITLAIDIDKPSIWFGDHAAVGPLRADTLATAQLKQQYSDDGAIAVMVPGIE
jgi:hypothetical protein